MKTQMKTKPRRVATEGTMQSTAASDALFIMFINCEMRHIVHVEESATNHQTYGSVHQINGIGTV